jgi:hypothetical protein
MTHLVEAAQKVNNHVSLPRELISGEPFHILSLFIFLSSSHPTRRVVPSINTPYVLPRTMFWLLVVNHIRLIAASLLSVLPHLCSCEFFLGLWEISLRSPTLCSMVSVQLRRIVWISPCLWFCYRSEIESKSFAVLVPLPSSFGHNQPLSSIKLVIPVVLQQFIICSWTYCHED